MSASFPTSLEPPRSLWRRLLGWLGGPTALSFSAELIWFLGRNYDQLETHEKSYPGYDLASLNLALKSFAEDMCQGSRVLGACQYQTNIRGLFDHLKQPFQKHTKPISTPFERVPVDVEEEESFPTNQVLLAVMKPEAGQSYRRQSATVAETPAAEKAVPEKVVVMLARSGHYPDYYDNLDGRYATSPSKVIISIACRERSVANRFFAEIEERRRRLSIFRGKVIEPLVSANGIHSIGFRPIQKVRENDLILPDEVKNLIRSSITGFYNHREKLEELGIEMKRGILFHSPPGTGKTSISLYLAGVMPKFTICFIHGDRLLYPREVCRMARYLQPAMVVFEDIDLVAEERNTSGLATVLGELMNQIDGCEVTEQVLFIMNTNSLERLEHAVRNRPGRVDQIIAIPLPSDAHREQLIRRFAQPLHLDLEDMRRILDATDGATPAMLKEIVKRAAVNALEEHPNSRPGEPLKVSESDLLLATEQVRALRQPVSLPGPMGFREGA